MGIQVTFLDQTGAKSVKASIAATVQVKTMIPMIIAKMLLPATAPDGQPMSYSLDWKEGGKRLKEDDTLPLAGVMSGDHLIVYPEIVAGMDTMEFRRIIEVLDQDVERARHLSEQRERSQKLEQKKLLLLHWEDGIITRKSELEKYGGTPSLDLAAKLLEIRSELADVLRQLTQGLDPDPEPEAPAVLAPEGRQALSELIGSVNSSVNMLEWPYEERLAQLRIWAATWRLITIQAGEAVVGKEAIFRAAYAAICNARDNAAPGTRLDALNPHATPSAAVWESAIRNHKEALAQLVSDRTTKERAANVCDDAVAELSAFIGAITPSSEEELRSFRHLVRKAASFSTARPEVAFLCRKYEEVLGSEFAFLFGDDEEKEPEEQASKRITPLQIVQRICRRMKSKAMIGACHAPWDMVAHGFPSHDYGRAEEALEALAKYGVVRKRRTGIGFRVSLEPTSMPAIDALIKGEPCGIPAIESWIAEA